MPKQQLELNLIHHQANGSVIDQRAADGYINATAMCKAAGKQWGHYWEKESAQAFIDELSADIGQPISILVQSVKGGVIQGTWIHPQVAIHLAQWLSPKFAVQVSKWVYDWLSGKGALTPSAPAALPIHMRRYMANDAKVPLGHFSILQETGISLFGPLHLVGFDVPKGWVPDISVGKLFCSWLRREHRIDTDSFPSYPHDYLDGRPICHPNAYPDEYLAMFRRWFRTVWLPENGRKYFRTKDPKSLAFLNLIPALAAPVRPVAIAGK